MEVCFVGDDARPPWNHASSALTKRMMECLSSSVKCTLITTAPEKQTDQSRGSWSTIAMRPSGKRALDAAKLGVLADRRSADIIHVIGTNALVFSPVYKLLGADGAIVRHIFTPYDRRDEMVRPLRRLVNNLFVGAYAFTTPWIGGWEEDLGSGVRRFLVRPPIDCELYKPTHEPNGGLTSKLHQFSLLYMGPLWPSRFPAENLLGALRLLLEKGHDVGLSVLTSARSSISLCENVLTLAKRLGLERNVDLERRDLSEVERVQAYNAADIVLFPYVGPEPEQLADPPFGILEAMACGKVVLSTKVLSVPEVVNDSNTGFLVETASSQDLYDGISLVLSHPNRDRVGKDAREWILKYFSYPTVRGELIKSYASLLND